MYTECFTTRLYLNKNIFKNSDTISVDYLDPLNFRCTKLNIGLSRCYTFTTRLQLPSTLKSCIL